MLDRNRFAASVSIRSGQGSMTHDRVMRLTPVFACRDAAARFASDHALGWIGAPVVPQESPFWPRKN